MHQFGYGADRDQQTSMRYYRKAASIGNHPKAFSKCGDYYYGLNDKKKAMAFYKKAADCGDIASYNNIGLMLEMGYDDQMPQHEQALQNYKHAHNKGNSDGTINIAIYYMTKVNPPDLKVGRALLLKAYQDRNPRAVDCMLQYGIVKSKREVEGLLSLNMIESLNQSNKSGFDFRPRSAMDKSEERNASADGDQSINQILSQIGLGTTLIK